MGNLTSWQQLADKMESAAAEISQRQRLAVRAAAAQVQKTTTAAMMAAAPGGHLRNVKNSRLTVTVKESGTDLAPVATVKGNGGAYAILDLPTRGHYIGAGKSTKKVKRGFGPPRPGKKSGGVLRLANGKFVTGPILHPGTKGKHTFAAGAEASEPVAVQTWGESITTALEEIFK